MLRLDKLTKTYGTKLILGEASYHFPAGERMALVGDNGTGKSTLLNIITGSEPADGGEVLVPPGLRLGYLPQEPNPAPRASVLEECEAGAAEMLALKEAMQAALTRLHTTASPEAAGDAGSSAAAAALAAYEKAEAAYRLAGGYGVAAKASSILAGLGFREAQLTLSPLALSGGWRMRLELAKLFMREPDFLILDEPTNHLDLPSLVWVEKYLMSFRGSLLFVSHDRALLNRLATLTLHLAFGRLTPYKGNFAAFEKAAAQRQATELAQAGQLAKRREGLQDFVDRFGAKATKARQAASKSKQIERLREEEAALAQGPEQGAIHFTLPPPLRSDRIVFRVSDGSIGYAAAAPLARKLGLEIERGQKIAVIGANGIGKSTLLKTMVGLLAPLGGEFFKAPKTTLAYFAQDQLTTLDAEKSVLDNVLAQSDIGSGEARKVLGGFLFRGDDVFKPMKVLSGGEKSRLGLACVLVQQANVLLLDEPTNHLDMKSAASLTRALQQYPGTLMFVSHDRSLIDEVASHVFVMTPDGRSMLFEGSLDDYLRLAPAAGFPNVLDPEAPSGSSRQAPNGSSRQAPNSHNGSSRQAPSHDSGSPQQSPALSEEAFRGLKRQKSKLEKDLANFDTAMERSQEKLAELDAELAACDPANYQRLRDLQAARDELAAVMGRDEHAWLEAQEQWEAICAEMTAAGRL